MSPEKGKSTDKSTDKRLKNLRPPFKPGESGNPGGRQLGQRNYATLYRLALIKIAESKGITPEQLETELLAAGIARSTSDYRFYKDMLDRLHGAPAQAVKLSGEVKTTNVFDADQMKRIAEEIAKKK